MRQGRTNARCVEAQLQWPGKVDALMNVVTGQTAHPGVNAGTAVSLGNWAMDNFKGEWPDSLYFPVGKLVVIMDVKKNHVLVG